MQSYKIHMEKVSSIVREAAVTIYLHAWQSNYYNYLFTLLQFHHSTL